jgi:hypothetical protein
LNEKAHQEALIFGKELSDLRKDSGCSLREIVKLTDGRLPRATICDAENAKAFPRLQTVVMFVTACRKGARSAGIEIDDTRFNLVYWHKRWRDAHRLRAGQSDQVARPEIIGVERYPNGVSVEWTEEGPRVAGRQVVLSPTESSALIDRWMEKITDFVREQEAELAPGHPSALLRGRVLASMRACGDTFNDAPSEGEMRQLSTELARKFDLFYKFIEIMHVRAGIFRHDTYEVPDLIEFFGGGDEHQ